MMIEDPGVITFINESRELLRDMEAGLLACERGEADAETINAIFRAAHTIKGSSGLFGLDAIVGFTHVVESVLDDVRAQKRPLNPTLVAILIRCCDHMTSLVNEVDRVGGVNDPLLQSTGSALAEELAAAGESMADDVPAAADASRAATDCWHISVRFNADVLKNGMDPLSFLRYLGTIGTIVGLQVVDHALPAADEMDPELCYVGFELALRADVDKSRIESAFEFVKDDCTLRILPPRAQVSEYINLLSAQSDDDMRLGELLVACGTLTAHELEKCLELQANLAAGDAAHVPPLGELLVGSKLVQAPVVEAALEKQREAKARDGKSDQRSIRVDGEKLDRLIDLIGELVIAGASTSLTARQAGLSELNESTMRLARLVEDVRDQALKLRMVQIGATFSRFHRVVRDVAQETGKDIALELSGTETELDKTLIESIADPLTHLVRNAIDHGIESPEVRLAAGKSAQGRVRLNAYHDSGSVVIEVEDDGRGLNRDRILAKAHERALLSDGEVLTDKEVYALIFEPGFSTAEKVTNLSGRGVGMDVVKRNVAALRGTVEIDTKLGQGTIVRIRLPLTLAIIDGFQVGVSRSSYVIPLEMVEECVELSDAQREAAHGNHYINLRGAVLPFIRLRELFQVAGSSARRESIVVVRYSGQRVGIVVDELLGELQTVIKPLPRLFSRIPGVGGSTVLGSGQLALILDIASLVEMTTARPDERWVSRHETPASALEPEVLPQSA